MRRIPWFQYIAQALPWRWKTRYAWADCVDQRDGEFQAAFKAYEDIRIVDQPRSTCPR